MTTAHSPQRFDHVVRTRAGSVGGTAVDGLATFRGIPYAQPPVGPLRFASPRPPVPWAGVRDATRFGPPFLQSGVDSSREDALLANVWTPDTAGRLPVLVYIHGGGWQLGAGSLPTYDGARLARRGDLVVVTFNYRLGVFGFGLHEDLVDFDTGSVANWGLQDQAALLRWAHENAEAFGGDPDDITLVGTSAGGASTHQLALLPQLRGIIRRIVPISAAHVRAPAFSLTPEDSRTVYEHIADRLGTTVPGLRSVPAAALHDAWTGVFSGSPTERIVQSGREYRGPVVDGEWMPGFDHESPPPDVPVLSVHTRTEGTFFTIDGLSGVPSPPAPTTEAELRDSVRAVLHKLLVDVPESLVDQCLAEYRDPAATPAAIWAEVWGDGLFRHPILRMADRHARTARTPQYAVEFAHPTTAAEVGTPHEATSKFLFGTHGIAENAALYGDSPLDRRISDTFVDLVASFARDGAPRCAGVPDWPVLRPGGVGTLVLGGQGVAELAVATTPRHLRFWDGLDRRTAP
jgi:para-nitrobenzyl esterase